MTVFHGSDIQFDTVLLSASKDKRDFGKGFYTTALREQAESWVKTLFRRNGTSVGYVYEFSFSLEGLNVKTFNGVTREWLDFIYLNRTAGGIQHDYDAVMGPVANDRIIPTLERYLDGTYSVEEALKRLEFMHPNDQVSIHTEKGLKNLKLVRRDIWNR
jgi:hypothetical protein